MIQVHRSRYGYDISRPSPPGCHSQGETEKETLENIQDAIREYPAARPDANRNEKVMAIDVAV